jgi:hypothetical protein
LVFELALRVVQDPPSVERLVPQAAASTSLPPHRLFTTAFSTQTQHLKRRERVPTQDRLCSAFALQKEAAQCALAQPRAAFQRRRAPITKRRCDKAALCLAEDAPRQRRRPCLFDLGAFPGGKRTPNVRPRTTPLEAVDGPGAALAFARLKAPLFHRRSHVAGVCARGGVFQDAPQKAPAVAELDPRVEKGGL